MSDPFEADGRTLPRGAMVRYREWDGGKQGAGLRLTAEELGTGILERDGKDAISYGVLDPSAFAQSGGPSIAERMFAATKGKINFRPADNTRVGVRGSAGGWDQVRARLKGANGVPMLYVFSTCVDTIRTLPVMQHDADRPEDLDTDGEDHCVDEVRYGCLSRPWAAPAPKERDVKLVIRKPTLAELVADHERGMRFSGRRI